MTWLFASAQPWTYAHRRAGESALGVDIPLAVARICTNTIAKAQHPPFRAL
jgi:hypothetical protein